MANRMYKGILAVVAVLLLSLLPAGGAMAQNKPQNKSQGTSHKTSAIEREGAAEDESAQQIFSVQFIHNA